MKSVNVFPIVGKPVLVSRESARSISVLLADGEDDREGRVCLDFSGARGVAPSFLDEALLVAEEWLRDSGHTHGTVILANLPSTMSSSHHAIARAHGRTLVENESGDWEFRKN